MKRVTYKFINHQLDDSRKLQESFNFINNFRIFSDMYRGYYPEGYPYVYNLYYSIFNSILATTYRKNPKVMVTSDDPADFYISNAIQKITNDWISDQGTKKLYRRLTLDALLGGFGVVQVGSGGYYGRSKDVVFSQLQRDFPELIDVDSSPDEIHDEDDEFVWARRIPPYDVLFPHESILDVFNMRFMAIRYYRKETHIKKDRRYTGTSRGNFLLFDEHDDSKNRVKSISNVGSKEKWGMLWDFYDNETQKIYTIVEGMEKIVKVEDMVTDRLPFSILNWSEDPDYPYPQSEAQVLYDKQLDIITADSQERDLRNTIKMILFLNSNKVNGEELDHLMDASNPRGYVLIDGEPSKNVLFGKYDLPNDLFKSKIAIESNARSEIGHGRNQSGGETSSRTTAAEAKIIQAGTNTRTGERIDAVLESIEEICALANQFRSEFWKSERQIFIPGLGKRFFNKDNLFPEGRISFKAVVYEASPENFEVQRIYVLQALDRLGNMGIPISLQVKLLREAFPEVTSIAEIEGLIKQAESQQIGQPQQADQTQAQL